MRGSHLRNGIAGGLAGGAIFGAMMGMMGMLPMIGGMVGVPSAAAGFAVHMMISAGIGAAFGLAAGDRLRGLGATAGAGAAYGTVWWLLGPLTLMPLFLGMGLGAAWSLDAAAQALPSLMGHLIFGAVLGLAYAALGRRESGYGEASGSGSPGRAPARGRALPTLAALGAGASLLLAAAGDVVAQELPRWSFEGQGGVAIPVSNLADFQVGDVVNEFSETYFTANGGLRVGYDIGENLNVFVDGQAYLMFTDEEDTAVFEAFDPGIDAFDTAWTIPVTAGLRIRI